MKNPAETLLGPEYARAPRRFFRNLLWRAFPAPSDNERAENASRALGVSPRQVKNWLAEENDASLRYVCATLAIAGAEIVFSRIEGRK